MQQTSPSDVDILNIVKKEALLRTWAQASGESADEGSTALIVVGMN